MKKTIIDPLTSARGFAAIYVVIYHIKDRLGGFALSDYAPALSYGWLGVDFFFILSGFILCYVYSADYSGGKFRFLDFILSRVARIYPVHVATLLIWVGLGAWAGFLWSTDRFGVSGFVLNLLMVHAWNVLPQNTWNFPAWSISAEWLAYLFFPALMFAVTRIKNHIVINVILVIVLILALQAFISVLPGRRFNWTYEWSMVRILCEFTAGMFLFRIYQHLKPSYAWDVVAVLAIGASAWLLIARPDLPWLQVETAVVLLTALCVLAFACMKGAVGSLLSLAPLTYLGRISYSMYMWHAAPLFVIGISLRRNFEGELSFAQGGLLFVVYLVAVLLGAVLLYHFVEKPARNIVRRAGSKWLGREARLEIERAEARASRAST